MWFLDDDFYKFTMQQAVLEKFPDAKVTYQFTNRRKTDTFTPEFMDCLNRKIMTLQEVRISQDEIKFMKSCGVFKPTYLSYLANYIFDTNEVSACLDGGQLKVEISGLWHKTILWEVRLMALISETYFEVCRPEWQKNYWVGDYEHKTFEKFRYLNDNKVKFIDFGTRRRRSHSVQEVVSSVGMMSLDTYFDNFIGTSNVHFAKRYGQKPVGTMAHEWIMGHSALCSLRHANRYALENWADVYDGKLGIALTDTYTTDAFLCDFGPRLARLYDGVRHDSSDPFVFIDKIVEHYKSLSIDHSTKTIVFSDSLTPPDCVRIAKRCDAVGIKCIFGIGTNLTNDFHESLGKALNMVIKLRTVNGIDVVKLSDEPSKATGETSALAEAKYVFMNTPISIKE